jgi:hypothetical protein
MQKTCTWKEERKKQTANLTVTTQQSSAMTGMCYRRGHYGRQKIILNGDTGL